ncbi:hypothetical protein CNF01050 [Cryptococcus deneoformans JEC21]|uniref:Glutamate-1-semialdehyde 2,1-aminomutase n=1 Tax=Cryptococcus deneoformans (strain JEC21 / ATCC MYA-565) TaxID=214684 RepID=Q5KFP5_CRYD1|nr:hypothetical protein CNF01050 [Cryptococcus neoformans var. neoformans JEC21]AAW44239.2 hypothetical protein CNF01050 [Cryptococcus neoformans var. neoformans JEC21]
MTSLTQALKRAQQTYANRNRKSYEAHQAASRHLPGGSTRSSIFIHPFPLCIQKGQGVKITDLDGHEYVDFVSDFTSGIYGKSHPVLIDAIKEALDNGLQLGAHTLAETTLASHFTSRFPSIELVRFANSGTEANILAISTAIKHTGRKKVLVFEGGYHGSVMSHFHMKGGDGDDLKVPFDFVVCSYNDRKATDALISQHPSEIGAILVEPMLGAGGCIPGDPAFLQFLREKASSIGAVLIFDEVQTARLSTGGRQKILGITPDLTTVGKFFGGGFAFGAFGGKKEIMEKFDARKGGAISHGGTFNNSPLTMVAGATAMEKILTEDALKNLNKLGDWMREEINRMFTSDGSPFLMTGLGSINQFHCTLSSNQNQVLDLLFFYLLERGFWIAQRGLVSLSFAMTKEDVQRFIEAAIEATQKVKATLK